jgi:hypothetical protein
VTVLGDGDGGHWHDQVITKWTQRRKGRLIQRYGRPTGKRRGNVEDVVYPWETLRSDADNPSQFRERKGAGRSDEDNPSQCRERTVLVD